MSGRNDELRRQIAEVIMRPGMSPTNMTDAILALPALRAIEERARVAEAQVKTLTDLLDRNADVALRQIEALIRRVAKLEGALRQAVEALLTAEVLIDADDSVDEFNRIQAVRKSAAALLPPEASRG